MPTRLTWTLHCCSRSVFLNLFNSTPITLKMLVGILWPLCLTVAHWPNLYRAPFRGSITAVTWCQKEDSYENKFVNIRILIRIVYTRFTLIFEYFFEFVSDLYHTWGVLLVITVATYCYRLYFIDIWYLNPPVFYIVKLIHSLLSVRGHTAIMLLVCLVH